MIYIINTLIVLIFSQLLKFIFRYFSNTTDSKNFIWVFSFATGAPSAHSAVLVSNLVLLYKDIGASSVFMFSCIISLIFMYNLVADRKREVIRGADQKTLDISGHTFFDIFTGILLGFLIGFIMTLWS
ncbi:MAG: divergent PAP2 family protein [Candidatus Pacebacteria bacterium]|nr:divergent PAP2 family protein [Candidatus Paceibacterota bacterium]MBP9839796.1 divergent PAP2 family protein [Candidatus Paceibacterota bacterium]